MYCSQYRTEKQKLSAGVTTHLVSSWHVSFWCPFISLLDSQAVQQRRHLQHNVIILNCEVQVQAELYISGQTVHVCQEKRLIGVLLEGKTFTL